MGGAAHSRREAPPHVWSSAPSCPPTRVHSAFSTRGLAASRSWSSEARDDEARIEDLKSTDATPVNPRKDLYMMFTCGVCETRAAKGFSRQAYENGVESEEGTLEIDPEQLEAWMEKSGLA